MPLKTEYRRMPVMYMHEFTKINRALILSPQFMKRQKSLSSIVMHSKEVDPEYQQEIANRLEEPGHANSGPNNDGASVPNPIMDESS